MVEQESNNFKKDTRRANVRFTEEEYARLKEECALAGLTIPRLLKDSHFRRKPLKLFLNAEDRTAVFAEIRRIGNNVNQIARKVNSGLLEGWYPEFQNAAQKLANLEAFLVGIYGIR